jgi:hypothetical protein
MNTPYYIEKSKDPKFLKYHNECWEKIKANNKRMKQRHIDNKSDVNTKAKQYRIYNAERVKKTEKIYYTHNRSVFGSLCHLYKAM